MPSDHPLTVDEVLTSEYRALRPDREPAASTEADLFKAVHADARPLSALCLSGGGIRSATFALGAIQGLAERGVLEQFDYLSTVSGGGYIGSWLVAWMNRVGHLRNVIPYLRRDAPPPRSDQPDPIQHLRDYNSYLTPRRGMLSFDVWALVSTMLRNMLLNWMVLIPLLMFVLMLPRVYLSVLAFPEVRYGAIIFKGTAPNYGAPELNAISTSPWVRYLLPLSSALLFGTAFFNTLRYLPGIGNREHGSYDCLTKVLVPLMGAVFTFLAFDSLYYLGTTYVVRNNLLSVILWAVVPSASAWILYLIACTRSLRERVRLLVGLSWAIFAMAAGAGAAAWLTTNVFLWSADPAAAPSWATYVTLGPPAILLGFGLGTVLFVGFSSAFLTDDDREWMSHFVGGVLMLSVGWTVVCGLVLIGPAWVLQWKTWGKTAVTIAGAASAWVTAFGGWAGSNTSAAAPPKTQSAMMPIAMKIATPLFIAVFAVGLSIATNMVLAGAQVRALNGDLLSWRDHNGMLTRSSLALVGLLAIALPALSSIMARYININTFSLHGMYRDRLVRAYLGASNPTRQANRFTGFADSDDLQMRDLDARLKPFPVINVTLNLVAADRLAWQQRKAQSFTVTPLACGNSDLGYRPSSAYGGRNGISLGTAAAISGAAASPNMGYHSSPTVSFIMTLFNARLGFWMGNPGPAGEQTWTHAGPRSAIASLVTEALGLTSNRSGYVYLSDGGHFENLGIYEMVKRRCRVIIVFDAASDPAFAYEDLGNALRKVRIDFKIPIAFDETRMRLLHERKKRCAIARINYSAVDGPCEDGYLIYVKVMCLGNEPPDVESYRAAHPAFPHESTANQWFDESQTESYRMLGLHTIDEICLGWKGGSLDEFCRHVENAYLAAPTAEGTQPRPQSCRVATETVI